MVQQHKPRKKPTEEIDLKKSFIMALIGVGILLTLFYFFNGAEFPSDISYENLKMEL